MSKQPGWRLADAAEIARTYPYTFWKPSDQLVTLLKPGDGVKLIFDIVNPGEGEPSGERMWVEITERTEEGFIGRLDNAPRHISDLQLGSIIAFEAVHIIDSSVADPVPDPTLKWQPRCFASNRILKDGRKVGYFYREEPDRPQDSGWRFMCGDESQEYMDDPANLQMVSLGAVLRCDDRMVHLLDAPPPAAFEWNEAAQRFASTDMPEELD
jgi:hypothetical protein